MSESDAVLLTSQQDGVRVLTLNRPQRRNALDTQLTLALIAALRAADADVTVGAVVLAGAGTCFSAGADLSEFKGERANAAAEAVRGDAYRDVLLVFGEIAVPVVATVVGPAIGLGGALVNVSDMAMLGESARLGYPEVRHGMVPGLMIPGLQAAVGRKQGFALFALGDLIDASQALAAGMANAVVADGEVMAAALEVARRLAAADRATLRETKSLASAMSALSIADALRHGRDASRRRAEARARADRSTDAAVSP